MQYPYAYTTLLNLFGYTKGRIAITELPGHLSYFTSHLVQKEYYTVDNVIENHTILPFYRPFLSDSEFEQVKSDAAGDQNCVVSPYTRSLNCGVLSQKWLRFCPLCAEEERRTLGMCYWHRTHQIRGVDVCAKHHVFLQNSIIPSLAKWQKYQFFSAEESVQAQLPIELDLSNLLDTILLRIAYDALWLMRKPALSQKHFQPVEKLK